MENKQLTLADAVAGLGRRAKVSKAVRTLGGDRQTGRLAGIGRDRECAGQEWNGAWRAATD